MKKLSALILAIHLGLMAGAATEPDPNDVILVPDGFNGVILVARNRQSPAVARSYGLANQETKQIFDARTQTQIGSASKFLTSIVVLRLVERGILNLDKPVSVWLPFLSQPAQGQVTLRHLLSNTSGIPNGVMDSYRKDPVFTARNISAFEAARLWGSGKLKFKPGTDWDYSLTNWVLVRAIIEAATGKSFEDVVHDELIAPLGLKDTGIPGPEFPNSAASATAYASLEPVKTRTNKIPPYAAASGTIYSSAADLRSVMDAVFGGGFLAPASVKELTTVQFEREGYALGGRVIDLPPTTAKILWEPGETSSYRALIAYEPVSGACVVLLNNTGMNPDSLANAAKTMLLRLLTGNGSASRPTESGR